MGSWDEFKAFYMKQNSTSVLKAKNVVQDDAGKKEEQKPQSGVKNVDLLRATNTFAPEFSPKTSSRSTTTPETKPKSQFSVVEHAANNPYLLKIPSSHHMDRSRIVEEEEHDATHHMEKDTSSMSFFWYFR